MTHVDKKPKYAVFQDAHDPLRIYSVPHLEKGNQVGQWAIINTDVSVEEAFSKSQYARPRVVCWLAGAGSRQQIEMLCDAMNNHPDYQSASSEDKRWRTDK